MASIVLIFLLPFVGAKIPSVMFESLQVNLYLPGSHFLVSDTAMAVCEGDTLKEPHDWLQISAASLHHNDRHNAVYVISSCSQAEWLLHFNLSCSSLYNFSGGEESVKLC